MQVIFFRHGATNYTDFGRVQGSSNSIYDNSLTSDARETVIKTSKEISSIIEQNKIKPEDIKIYSSKLLRCSETTAILASIWGGKGQINAFDSVIEDERLDARGYGNIEGYDEAEVKKTSFRLKHPKMTVAYLLSELGFKNSYKIEPKKRFYDRIESFVWQLLMENKSNPNALVILSSSSEVFKALQKCESLHKFCYFGDEKAPEIILDGSKPYTSKMSIKVGEAIPFIMEKPKIDSKGNEIPVYKEYADNKVKDEFFSQYFTK